MTEVLFAFLYLVNMVVFMIIGMAICDECDGYPVFCQPYFWGVLDECNINFAGKLILCILITPFTIGYTVGALILHMGCGLCKLFYMLFQKKSEE